MARDPDARHSSILSRALAVRTRSSNSRSRPRGASGGTIRRNCRARLKRSPSACSAPLVTPPFPGTCPAATSASTAPLLNPCRSPSSYEAGDVPPSRGGLDGVGLAVAATGPIPGGSGTAPRACCRCPRSEGPLCPGIPVTGPRRRWRGDAAGVWRAARRRCAGIGRCSWCRWRRPAPEYPRRSQCRRPRHPPGPCRSPSPTT